MNCGRAEFQDSSRTLNILLTGPEGPWFRNTPQDGCRGLCSSRPEPALISGPPSGLEPRQRFVFLGRGLDPNPSPDSQQPLTGLRRRG